VTPKLHQSTAYVYPSGGGASISGAIEDNKDMKILQKKK